MPSRRGLPRTGWHCCDQLAVTRGLSGSQLHLSLWLKFFYHCLMSSGEDKIAVFLAQVQTPLRELTQKAMSPEEIEAKDRRHFGDREGHTKAGGRGQVLCRAPRSSETGRHRGTSGCIRKIRSREVGQCSRQTVRFLTLPRVSPAARCLSSASKTWGD